MWLQKASGTFFAGSGEKKRRGKKAKVGYSKRVLLDDRDEVSALCHRSVSVSSTYTGFEREGLRRRDESNEHNREPRGHSGQVPLVPTNEITLPRSLTSVAEIVE